MVGFLSTKKKKKKEPPYRCSLEIIISFLTEQYNIGASFSTLNSEHAALSLVFSIEGKDKVFLKRFLKGIYKQKPPRAKYHATWDPICVLNYLEKIFLLEETSMKDLTQKMVTLLALITGHRIQTLSKIKISNITRYDDRMEIQVSDFIKTSGRQHFQPLLVLPYFTNNPKLCVASVITAYIERTKNIRPKEMDYLILTHKSPIHPATTQRIGKWIKTTLADSGVNIAHFSAHSTRHATTSAAYRAGVSIETIRKTAGWTDKSNTFNKFYNRLLCSDPTLFARAILNSYHC